jgi:two-component system phosphate regulon sensor histidine kinase PhoR
VSAATKTSSSEHPTGHRKSHRTDGKGRNWQRLGYRRIVTLLVYLVIVPTVLLLSTGIVMMFFEARTNLLFGILTVSFVAAVVTGVILVMVFLRREANLAELQADFVSKVSHELRTPLTAIRLFAETMERAKDDPTQEQCRRHLVEESERLTRLIERLLDWGRMEAGRKLYDLRIEESRAIIEEAARLFGAERYPDLRFEVELAEELPRVRADKAAIIDALLNLLSNARKYGGNPPIVRLTATTTERGEVAIHVIDNGEGIPRVEHGRIFQKFYRIDDRLSRAREGSGLGLAIVKHIARAHSARVVLESAKGRGSTFTLLLPAADEDPAIGREEIALNGPA